MSGKLPNGPHATTAPGAPTATERGNISRVCRHLALVAIDGATDEVADGLDAGFRLHLGHACTDRWGYLALIEANHAAHGARPPLDVVAASASGDFVTARLEPRCLAYVRLAGGLITELWIVVDWNAWSEAVIGPANI